MGVIVILLVAGIAKTINACEIFLQAFTLFLIFGTDKLTLSMNIYRNIEKISFFCLVCNFLVSLSSLAQVQIRVDFSDNNPVDVLSFFYRLDTELDGNKDFIIMKKNKRVETIDTDLTNPTFFKFHIHNGGPFDFINLLIYPKDTLNISFDNNNKMKFNGTREIEWNFEAKLLDLSINFAELYKRSFSESPFTNTVVQKSKKEISFLDSLLKNNTKLSIETIALLKNEQIFHHLYALLIDHRGIKNSTDIDFNDYIKNLFKFTTNYNDFAGSYFYPYSLYMGTDFLDENRSKDFVFENLITTAKLILAPNQRDILTLNVIREQIRINFDKTEEGLKKIKLIISEFKGYTQNQGYITVLENLLESDKLKANLKILYNSDEKLFTSNGFQITWKDFMKKVDGQNVLIDVWATWCVPCIKGINIMTKDTLFNNQRNFKVIYISVDKLSTDWLNGISKFNMEGSENFKIDPDSKIFELLSFDKAVPKYILIRENGTAQALDNFSANEQSSRNIILELLK